jgi:hypothetical protein
VLDGTAAGKRLSPWDTACAMEFILQRCPVGSMGHHPPKRCFGLHGLSGKPDEFELSASIDLRILQHGFTGEMLQHRDDRSA